MTKSRKARGTRFGLSKAHTRKSARDFVDFDYIDDLSESDKDWLDKFSREYYQATFRNTKTDLHNKQEQRRSCYRDNNSRNRDAWNNWRRQWFDHTPTLNTEAEHLPRFTYLDDDGRVIVRHTPNPPKEGESE